MSVFVLGRLYQSHFDFSSFVVAGDGYCDPALFPRDLVFYQTAPASTGSFIIASPSIHLPRKPLILGSR